jgi:hypothetical protein
MSPNFTPHPQIISIFPSNKVGLFIEDCTHLRSPKIRLALVPTGVGSGEPVEFFIDLPVARVLFGDLVHGSLPDDALFKQVKGKSGQIPAFDLFATIGENGHRALTITNMTDGIAIKIVKKNDGTFHQKVSLSSFQARTIGQAVNAYLQQLDLIALARKKAGRDRQDPQDQADGFINDYQEEFPG